jgi:hypothetical protein
VWEIFKKKMLFDNIMLLDNNLKVQLLLALSYIAGLRTGFPSLNPKASYLGLWFRDQLGPHSSELASEKNPLFITKYAHELFQILSSISV